MGFELSREVGDKTVRLWSAQTHQQIGEPFLGHTGEVMSVSESSDGMFVVPIDKTPETIIWDRRNERSFGDQKKTALMEIIQSQTSTHASIIQSCGRRTPHLWPSSLPEYTADLHCKGYALYSNVTGEKILLGNFPSNAWDWEYEELGRIIVAGLSSGAVARCRLVAES